jgi:hypothetical protein
VQKDDDEQMMDFIAGLQQLWQLASTTVSLIGDDVFVMHLCAGLPSDYNKKDECIEEYKSTRGET